MKGWKTLAVMAAISMVGVAQTADWATLVPPQYAGVALIVVGAIGAVLRLVTTTPVGKAQ